jgi:hypothetical protein
MIHNLQNLTTYRKTSTSLFHNHTIYTRRTRNETPITRYNTLYLYNVSKDSIVFMKRKISIPLHPYSSPQLSPLLTRPPILETPIAINSIMKAVSGNKKSVQRTVSPLKPETKPLPLAMFPTKFINHKNQQIYCNTNIHISRQLILLLARCIHISPYLQFLILLKPLIEVNILCYYMLKQSLDNRLCR